MDAPSSRPGDARERGDVVLHAAVSLDGYLAGPGHDLGFLDDISQAAPVYASFYDGVAALVMGRTTYDVVQGIAPEWPYPGKPCVVVTSRPLGDSPPEVSVDDGSDLAAVIDRLAAHGRVWVVGGGVLARAVLAAGLLDEIDVVITPHLLGSGAALWGSGTSEAALALTSVTDLGAGAVRVRYRVARTSADERPRDSHG